MDKGSQWKQDMPFSQTSGKTGISLRLGGNVLIPILFAALMIITVSYTAYSLHSLRQNAATMVLLSSLKSLRYQYISQVFITSQGLKHANYQQTAQAWHQNAERLLQGGGSIDSLAKKGGIQILPPPNAETRELLVRKIKVFSQMEKYCQTLLQQKPGTPLYQQVLGRILEIQELQSEPKNDLMHLYFLEARHRFDLMMLIALFLVILTGGTGLALTIQQYRASRILSQSEKRFRQIFDTPPLGKILESTTGEWLRVNPALCAMLGYTESELLQQDPATLIHPEDWQSERQLRAKLLNEQIKTYQVNQRFFHKDGHLIWTMATAGLLRDSNNRPEAIVHHLLDITEHLSTLAALRGSENRYRTVFESAQNGIVLAEPNGNILSANPYTHELFGYEPGELVGQPITILMPKRFRAAHENGMRRLRETGHSRLAGKTLEVSGLRKDGTEFPLELTLSIWLDEQQNMNITGIIQDISERLHAEEERAALIKSNKALNEFATVAAHDLQEPLRKISLYTGRLNQEMTISNHRETSRYTEKILTSVERMQNLIRDLLSYSEASLQPLELSKVELNQVIQDVLKELKPQINKANAEIQVDSLPVIMADSSQLRRLFRQIILNALKFCRNGVSPVIHIYGKVLVKDTFLGQAEFAEIRIQDNGIGFDEKYLDRIFKVFQRLHSPGEYSGTGTGLAICRRITEQHHGTITATSQPSAGTTFIITLPVSQSTTEEIGKLQ